MPGHQQEDSQHANLNATPSCQPEDVTKAVALGCRQGWQTEPLQQHGKRAFERILADLDDLVDQSGDYRGGEFARLLDRDAFGQRIPAAGQVRALDPVEHAGEQRRLYADHLDIGVQCLGDRRHPRNQPAPAGDAVDEAQRHDAHGVGGEDHLLLGVKQRFAGGLHIVVNNAGTTHRNKPALQVTEEEFDRVYRVNLKSLYWSAQFALPHFTAQGHGVMVNVASTTGVRPGPGLTWYSGSKAAMINITKGLALEFARGGIRINAVNPMIGETPMMADFMGMEDTPANREKFLARIPLGRFTQPNDVASAVAFLASDDASFLTGVCLDVDGGRNI